MSITSTGHPRECPWLGGGRPDEAPRHVHPIGHGGVSGTPDGDGRWTNSEGASGAGVRRRERGRAAWLMMEGRARRDIPTSARWGKRADGCGHAALGPSG
jgi:hypothetical protein